MEQFLKENKIKWKEELVFKKIIKGNSKEKSTNYIKNTVMYNIEFPQKK
jgi:hypothetical protein